MPASLCEAWRLLNGYTLSIGTKIGQALQPYWRASSIWLDLGSFR